jgi:hypothetical protein
MKKRMPLRYHITGGICAPNGPACLNSACRTRRVNHVTHAPEKLPESLDFGTKNRWQVEVRQPCRASADRAVIMGANVDAYGPAEKWEWIGRKKKEGV